MNEVYRYRAWSLRPNGDMELQTTAQTLFTTLEAAEQGSPETWVNITPELWTCIKPVPDGQDTWMMFYVIDKIRVFS